MTLERRVVLVPVDRPVAPSREALQLGAQLAALTGRRLVVVHVDPTFDLGRGRDWIDASLPRGTEVVVESTSADPAAVILHKIRRAGSPLVVMATSGHRIATPIWGSVTERVVHSSPVAALLVGPNVVARPDALAGPVTLCLDGTPTADAMIGPASEFAAEIGAPVDLVGVGHWASPGHRRDPERWAVASVSGHLAEVAATRPLAGNRLLDEPTRIEADGVVEALVDRAGATGSSALAMATHSRAGMRRLVSGSLVVDTVQRASTPVLTIAARAAGAPACSG